MPRVRVKVEATAESPMIRALQTAVQTAGGPTLRDLAEKAGVGYGTLFRAIRRGHAADAVRVIEKVLATLGYEVVVKYVGGGKYDRNA
jgi:DNA-binding phage protein